MYASDDAKRDGENDFLHNRARLVFLKKELNSPKEELMRIRSQIAEISSVEAEKLGKIIGRLEDFQHK